MNNKKHVIKSLVVAFCLLMVLSACGSNPKETTDKGNEGTNKGLAEQKGGQANGQLEHVELVWHYPQVAIEKDMQLIEDEINKITEKKINATIKIKQQVFGDYAQKMNAIIASGEQADIMFTSNWSFDYAQNQAKGAFAPLDELIEKYGPSIKKDLPSYALEAAKIGGKVYAIPNNKFFGTREGLVIQKSYADKYNLDLKSIKKLEDLEPFLEQVHAGEPKDIVPVVLDRMGRFSFSSNIFNMELIGTVGAIRIDEPTKVMNVFETDEYKNYLDLMRKWYTAGYINEDAATLKNTTDRIKTGKVATVFYNLEPGAEVRQKNFNGGHGVVSVPLMDTYVTTGGVIDAAYAIGANSKNKERAMMFLDLLHSEKALHTILSNGLEGKHYTKIGENTIKVIENSGYNPNAYWLYGNTLHRFILEGQSPDIVEETIKGNQASAVSPILGFVFDTEPVSIEIANIASLIDQYKPGLETGTIDSKDKLAEFLDKMKKAGVDKVIAEIQNQLDAWNKKKQG